jgi:hypothetical protein
MLHGLVMDCHNSLNLTYLLLLYLFVNILYIWTQFILLNTFWQERSRLVTLCKELLYINNFDRYTVSMTLFESTEHNVTYSHVNYIWTLILLLNTFCNEWSRLLRLFNEYLYIISFDVYTVSKTLFDANEHNISVSHFRYIWTLFLLLKTFWHELSRLVTPCNEFLYIISYDVYTVSKTFFDAT